MKYIAIKSLVVSSSLLTLSCSRSESVSETKEAVDGNSSLELLGDIGSPTVSDITAVASVASPTIPWTDTYWPLTEKSLARRWKPSEQAIGIAEYFTSQTAQDKVQKVDPYLSPADKYDILYRWRHNVKIDEAKVTALTTDWQIAEDGLDMSAIPGSRGLVNDVLNQFNSAESAEFRRQFPMSANGWNDWLYYTSNDRFQFMDDESSGENWGWMGACHGWAAAALLAETPKHAVLAKFEDKEVLLTEGDIRGLLTKSWADHAPSDSQYFIGRRCEQNSADPEGEIPHDENGHAYYGQIIRGEEKTGFFVKSEMYASFKRSNDRIYPVSYGADADVQGFLLETYQGRRRYAYVLAKSMADLRSYIVDQDRSKVEVLPGVEMFGCWDVNPATFHMALLQKIGKEQVGLVMDRTRTGQVWNQPVYAADFTFGERIPFKKGLFSRTHAPNTKYILPIEAKVKWISEPAVQSFAYTAEYDKRHTVETRYTYFLEFDRDDKLLGGGWGTLEGGDSNLVTPDFIYGFDKGSKPVDDFRNGFDYSGIVEQIHNCSLSDKAEGKTTLETSEYNSAGRLVVRKQSIHFSDCVLTKAQ